MPDPSAEKARERFIVALSQLTKSNTMDMVGQEEISKITGTNAVETRNIALHLHERGWVKVELTSGGALVSITPKGIEAAEEAKLTWWGKLMNDRTASLAILVGLVTAVVSSVLTAVLTAFLTALFTRWFGH